MPARLTTLFPAVGQPIPASWGDEVAQSGFVDEVVNSGGTVALTTVATDYLGVVSSTFTLQQASRVKLTAIARYQAAAAVQGRMVLYAGYNSGGSAVVGSAVRLGTTAIVSTNVAGIIGSQSATAIGTGLLAAGTYTAYPVVNRGSGGSATDVATGLSILIEILGVV